MSDLKKGAGPRSHDLAGLEIKGNKSPRRRSDRKPRPPRLCGEFCVSLNDQGFVEFALRAPSGKPAALVYLSARDLPGLIGALVDIAYKLSLLAEPRGHA